MTLKRLAFFIISTVILTACGNDITVYGYVPHNSKIEEANTLKANRAQVRQMFGAPFTQGTFDDNIWFYIERRTRIRGILEPELLDQRVLVVEFDAESGNLSDTRLYEVSDANVIQPVERVTESRGQELTIIGEILGNIGRMGGAAGGGLPGL